jgi:cell division septal protein FtsQ
MTREQEIREEGAAAEARRREALRQSVIRQAIGGAFVACGLVVGTLGGVAQL